MMPYQGFQLWEVERTRSARDRHEGLAGPRRHGCSDEDRRAAAHALSLEHFWTCMRDSALASAYLTGSRARHLRQKCCTA